MATDNLSLVLKKVDDLVLEQRPIVKPGKDEVQVRIHCVGICGSDVHYWKHGRIGDFVVTKPMVLGHEPSGVVSEIGPGVTNLKPGDRVVIEPGVPCFICEFCMKGSYNLCKKMAFCATPPYDGALCRYYSIHSSFCHKIPDNVSLEEAAVVEPLAVAVHACRRAQVSVGKTVLITGAGPIGLVNLLTTKAMGASKVYMTDIAQNRLDFAKTQGADEVILCDTKDADAFAKKVLQIIGTEVDVALECSGAESSVQLAIKVVKPGGVLTTIGMGGLKTTIPLLEASIKEVDIRGVFRYANCHPTAISMIASGKVNVKPLITHRFSLEESVKAFEVSRTGAGNAIKVMINCA